MAEVYLLHFERPYWRKCQHYLGYTKYTTQERCAIHKGEPTSPNGGKPSRLVRYALRKGIDFVIAHIEHFDEDWQARQRERRIKNDSSGSLNLCPICNPRQKRRR